MPGANSSPPANGAASTRTFFTHCRGRMVFSTPRATPTGVRGHRLLLGGHVGAGHRLALGRPAGGAGSVDASAGTTAATAAPSSEPASTSLG